jgi:hypothetical protein
LFKLINSIKICRNKKSCDCGLHIYIIYIICSYSIWCNEVWMRNSRTAVSYERGETWITATSRRKKLQSLLRVRHRIWILATVMEQTHTHRHTHTHTVAWVRERTILSDRRLTARLVPTFAGRGCRVVSVAEDPLGRDLGFLDRSRYFFFQVAPQLYSRGWVDPVPDPLLLRKCGSAGNQTRTSGSVAMHSDY